MPEKPGDRIWDVLCKLAVAGVVGLATWQMSQESQINGNRERLSVLESRELPPSWLLSSVSELKNGQKDIIQRLTRLEAEVEGITR